MFGRLGWTEILVIVILVMILFGHKKIPGMMKNLADGLNVFKKELKNTKAPAKSEPVKKATVKKKTVKKK
ncbi:MAG: twin-arginine translocase TatA/TatE family subunit [Alphaproteobacteria bacterium]|nr:twin-arginine translocase TatA/TatE family subunit [Alphaproteobacteria bacterium]